MDGIITRSMSAKFCERGKVVFNVGRREYLVTKGVLRATRRGRCLLIYNLKICLYPKLY